MKIAIKYLIYLYCICLICACTNKMNPMPTKQDVLELTNGEPEAKSFSYFNPSFKLEKEKALLHTDGIYFRIAGEDTFGDLYNIVRFYPDGLVIEYQVYNTPDKVWELEKSTPGNIHGYYTIEGDSLQYSTKVYYNHDPKFFKGKIYTDSLIIMGTYDHKENVDRTFYFYEENKK